MAVFALGVPPSVANCCADWRRVPGIIHELECRVGFTSAPVKRSAVSGGGQAPWFRSLAASPLFPVQQCDRIQACDDLCRRGHTDATSISEILLCDSFDIPAWVSRRLVAVALTKHGPIYNLRKVALTTKRNANRQVPVSDLRVKVIACFCSTKHKVFRGQRMSFRSVQQRHPVQPLATDSRRRVAANLGGFDVTLLLMIFLLLRRCLLQIRDNIC